MNLSREKLLILEKIQHDIFMLKCDVEYEGYAPNRPTHTEAIVSLCQQMSNLIDLLKDDSDYELTNEDYEIIYGPHGQG